MHKIWCNISSCEVADLVLKWYFLHWNRGQFCGWACSMVEWSLFFCNKFTHIYISQYTCVMKCTDWKQKGHSSFNHTHSLLRHPAVSALTVPVKVETHPCMIKLFIWEKLTNNMLSLKWNLQYSTCGILPVCPCTCVPLKSELCFRMIAFPETRILVRYW